MTIVIFIALGLSTAVYLAMGVWCSFDVRGPEDILPLLPGKMARVASHQEFAASTVAATISLATVVVAFYELVPALGLWLLWTAATTALGLLSFGLLAPRIWNKMLSYDFRPTIHSYLGTEFGSEKLAMVASLFTAIGYLSAFAVELTVGSRFLAGLLEQTPHLLVVFVIAIVTLVYTGLGGFRVVVITDRIQMWFIWLLIIALGSYYIIGASTAGWHYSIERIPLHDRSFYFNTGLWPFILGIAVMNLLTFVCNMGLWQRIAGSQTAEVVVSGMWSSVLGSALSWSLLVLSAVGALMFVAPLPNENLLVTLLRSIFDSFWGKTVVFCVALGLYGAMLSTASTQLIAVSHTIYEDVLAPFRKRNVYERAHLKQEVLLSRMILFCSSAAAIIVVEVLSNWGFTIADLAFAVYGAALGLAPPVLLSLFVSRDTTQRLGDSAMWAVALGFISCWCAAAYGRATANENLVFLSPIASTTVATSILLIGWLHVWAIPYLYKKKILGK